MQHRITHSLSTEQAQKVAHAAADSYVERFAQYAPQVTWPSDDRAQISFKAKGIRVEGQLLLTPGAIVIDLDVPFLLKPFSGRAIATIEDQVKRWIDKAQQGAL